MIDPIDRTQGTFPTANPSENLSAKYHCKEFEDSWSGANSLELAKMRVYSWAQKVWEAIKYYVLFCWFDSTEDKRQRDLQTVAELMNEYYSIDSKLEKGERLRLFKNQFCFLPEDLEKKFRHEMLHILEELIVLNSREANLKLIDEIIDSDPFREITNERSNPKIDVLIVGQALISLKAKLSTCGEDEDSD